ncbi:hypothetical protein BBOU_1665 [Bifidobacterium boum]|uniref:Uncharacterized protein n=1 Tax=Bifidobacterium boum TaxID=78343 RepID=A0A086ZF99_9BIFI|nr:hypothetical protein BBOU_1665 [Bifidobacterium boum]
MFWRIQVVREKIRINYFLIRAKKHCPLPKTYGFVGINDCNISGRCFSCKNQIALTWNRARNSTEIYTSGNALDAVKNEPATPDIGSTDERVARSFIFGAAMRTIDNQATYILKHTVVIAHTRLPPGSS